MTLVIILYFCHNQTTVREIELHLVLNEPFIKQCLDHLFTAGTLSLAEVDDKTFGKRSPSHIIHVFNTVFPFMLRG